MHVLLHRREQQVNLMESTRSTTAAYGVSFGFLAKITFSFLKVNSQKLPFKIEVTSD